MKALSPKAQVFNKVLDTPNASIFADNHALKHILAFSNCGDHSY